MGTSETNQSLTRRNLLRLGIGAAGTLLTPARAATAAQPTAVPATSPGVGGPKRGGVLKIARSPRITNFNAFYMTRGHFAFMRALYNTPLRLDDRLEPQPEIASSWQFSPDGTRMILRLRQDVKFHTGRDLTSEDIKFSLEFAKLPETSASMLSAFDLIKDIKVPEKYTAELYFDKPNPLIFDTLDLLFIYDKSVVDNIARVDAGSGPFRVDKYIPPDEVYMTRFAAYWDKGRPYADEYHLKSIPDAAALALNFEAQAVDAVWAPTFKDAARLKGQKGIVATDGPGAQGMCCVAVRPEAGPLSDKKVRQAINYAIDRERCARVILENLVTPTCLMWPRGSLAYFADLEGKYSYNPEKAKALLAEAGHPNGFKTSIMLSRAINPVLYGFGQILQADLAKLGIEARIEDVESTLYTRRILGGQYEMAVHNYGRANRDPGTTLMGDQVWRTRKEGGKLVPDFPDFGNWRDEAARTMETQRRQALYRKIQEWILEESFVMPIAGNVSYWLYRDHVRDLKFTRESSPWADVVWLDS
jgi:peptide/nickel transport system substrate-binding protein